MEEGIKPSIYANQTNYPFGLGYDAMHNHNFSFFCASADRYKHIWPSANGGLIYLNNEYVAKHSKDFFNGTYRNNDGNFIFDGHIPSWEDTLNSKEFTSFCKENNIMPINPVNRIKRITNQIVSGIVPNEAFESVVVFNEVALDEIKPNVPVWTSLYMCKGEYVAENVNLIKLREVQI